VRMRSTSHAKGVPKNAQRFGRTPGCIPPISNFECAVGFGEVLLLRASVPLLSASRCGRGRCQVGGRCGRGRCQVGGRCDALEVEYIDLRYPSPHPLLITVPSLFSEALRPPEEVRRPKDILRLITYNRAREPTTEDFDKRASGGWTAGAQQAWSRPRPYQVRPAGNLSNSALALACSEAQTLTHALKPNVTRYRWRQYIDGYVRVRSSQRLPKVGTPVYNPSPKPLTP
jgi:hypothetical protein